MQWKTGGEARRAVRGQWKEQSGDDEFRAAAAYAYEDVCAKVSDYGRFIEVCRTIPWGRVAVVIDSMARRDQLPDLDDYRGFTVIALLHEFPCVPQHPHLMLAALEHPKVLECGVTPFVARQVAKLDAASLALLAETDFDLGHPRILWTAVHERAALEVLDVLEPLCADVDWYPEGEPSTFLLLKARRLRSDATPLGELLAGDREAFIVAAFWRMVEGLARFKDVSAMLDELPYLWTFAHNCPDHEVPAMQQCEQKLLDWIIASI